MLKLPDIRQRDSFDCGAAAVHTVFKFLGHTMPYQFYINLLGSNGMNGTDPRCVETMVRQQKLKVISGEMTIGDLSSQTKMGRPVIVLVTLHNSGHYVVVSGVKRNYVYFQDPAVGPQKLKAVEFVNVWTDYDRFGMTYTNFGISVWR